MSPISQFADRSVAKDFMVQLVRANARTPAQTVGDMYSLAACIGAGNRRLQVMLDEFGLDNIDGLSDFIIDASRRATRAAISKVPGGTFTNEMRVDGYEASIDLKFSLTITGDQAIANFDGTSGMSKSGVNVPEVYSCAYACYALK